MQEDFAGKYDEVTADKQERAALQRAHHASVKASIHCTQTPPYYHVLRPPPLLSSPPSSRPPPPPHLPIPSTLADVIFVSACALVARYGISGKPYSIHCRSPAA